MSRIYKERSWSDDRREKILLRNHDKELKLVQMCVRVTYNESGTDFSVWGPFNSYAAAVRFKERLKGERKGAVKIEECALHAPTTLGVT